MQFKQLVRFARDDCTSKCKIKIKFQKFTVVYTTSMPVLLIQLNINFKYFKLVLIPQKSIEIRSNKPFETMKSILGYFNEKTQSKSHEVKPPVLLRNKLCRST